MTKFIITNPHGTSRPLNVTRSIVKQPIQHAHEKSRVIKVVEVKSNGKQIEFTAEEFMAS